MVSDCDPVVAAYLAGVIDSDGYITIHRSTRKGVVYYAARIGITGTRPEPHMLAAELWGGKVSRHVPKNPSHRVQYQWSRTGDGAIEPILVVRPYLRVKVEQASIALALQEHVIAGRGDDPFPWFGPDYDPTPYRAEARAEIVEAMRAAGRELDGATWSQMPEAAA